MSPLQIYWKTDFLVFSIRIELRWEREMRHASAAFGNSKPTGVAHADASMARGRIAGAERGSQPAAGDVAESAIAAGLR